MPAIDTFSEAISSFGVERDSNRYAKAALKMYAEEGRIEIDDTVVVSEGEGGAYVMAWVWVSDGAALQESASEANDVAPATPATFVTSQFLNHYKCPNCEHEWTDVWTAQCDDDCPSCGTRHVSPHKSEDA